MIRGVWALRLLLLALALAGCERRSAATAPAGPNITTLRVAAAVSLSDVLHQLSPMARRMCGIELVIDSGSSGTLAQQIIHGAPADLFISANVQWMDELQRRGLVNGDLRTDLWRNHLVAICSASSRISAGNLSDLANLPGRIAIGEPSSVPAGRYAEQALTAEGVWTRLQPRLLPSVDVRAALTYVSRGEADAGLVYATDAQADKSSVRVLFIVPDSMHDAIVYPVAAVTSSRHRQAVGKLIAFLRSSAAAAVANDAGFTPAGQDAEGVIP